jgi:sugar phosphate isomerase/epimerase
LDLDDAIVELAQLGFASIDVPPAAATEETRQRIRSLELKISCVALERGQPDGIDLGSEDEEKRRHSVAYFCRAIEASAALGAPTAYVTPPIKTDQETRRGWSDSILQLADHAQQHNLCLAIEHFPGRLLPTASATMDFLSELNHPKLALLVDVGHCLISHEEPADIVRNAGRQLGYIHFDDNDGESDLHWALMTGVLRQSQIEETIDALYQIGYAGGVCLELNSQLDHPQENLRMGARLLEQIVQQRESN